MTVTERLLHYVSFDTQSDESSETCPSTAKQKLLGEALVEEMRALGIADARIDADGYVYGSVPGTPGAPAIGLIAHMDTSPDCSGKGIKPRIVEYTKCICPQFPHRKEEYHWFCGPGYFQPVLRPFDRDC